MADPIKGVQAIEPGVSPQTLTFNVQNDVLEIVLPAVVFYKLIDISAAGPRDVSEQRP